MPDHARPILRALDDQYEPVLEVPGRAAGEAVDDRAPQNDDFAVALGWLLRGRSASIPVDDAPAPIRASFEALRAAEILELKRGAYRASRIALYSSFAEPQPPARSY